jgi:glycosyltransferase involved in cell wall biosynthesis
MVGRPANGPETPGRLQGSSCALEYDQLNLERWDRLPRIPVAFYLPQVVAGGAENNFAKIASALNQKGFSVEILVSRLNRPFSPHLDPSVEVVELKPVWGVFRFFSLLAYLRRKKPVVLMCGLEGPILLGCFVKCLRLTQTRVVASLRNRDDILIEDFHEFFKRWIFKFLYTRLIGSADHIIAVAGKLKDDYLVPIAGISPEKISVIYNPVQLQKVRLAAEQPVREDWFGKIDGGFLLAVGRLELQKDYPTLLRAFSIVKEKKPLKLLILGEGTERPALESLVRELGLEKDVLLPGYSSNPFRFMKKAEVFVFSSKHEGFGNVLLEAMACGVPIVSTDCPAGPSEILEDGKWGKLVPVGDPQALATAILDTLEHAIKPDYSRRLEYFDFDKTVEKYRVALGLPETTEMKKS